MICSMTINKNEMKSDHFLKILDFYERESLKENIKNLNETDDELRFNYKSSKFDEIISPIIQKYKMKHGMGFHIMSKLYCMVKKDMSYLELFYPVKKSDKLTGLNKKITDIKGDIVFRRFWSDHYYSFRLNRSGNNTYRCTCMLNSYLQTGHLHKEKISNFDIYYDIDNKHRIDFKVKNPRLLDMKLRNEYLLLLIKDLKYIEENRFINKMLKNKGVAECLIKEH